MVEACRVYTHVGDLSSMTAGAAAAGVPQPVASRRIAALEKHLGGKLFDRTGHGVTLTPLGTDMLTAARRLVNLADSMILAADRARLRPLTVAVPMGCPTRNLAVLAATVADRGVLPDFQRAAPLERERALTDRRVRAGFLPVPAGEGTWTVELGVAGRVPVPGPVSLSALRPSRAPIPGDSAQLAGRRMRVLPEDDVPHVRDTIRRAAGSAGMLPSQIIVDESEPTAVAGVLSTGDLLLCSEAEALTLRLEWTPLAVPVLSRGYVVAAISGEDTTLIRSHAEEVADCLGGTPTARRGHP